MKRGRIVLGLFLISVLVISGCGNGAELDTSDTGLDTSDTDLDIINTELDTTQDLKDDSTRQEDLELERIDRVNNFDPQTFWWIQVVTCNPLLPGAVCSNIGPQIEPIDETPY